MSYTNLYYYWLFKPSVLGAGTGTLATAFKCFLFARFVLPTVLNYKSCDGVCMFKMVACTLGIGAALRCM